MKWIHNNKFCWGIYFIQYISICMQYNLMIYHISDKNNLSCILSIHLWNITGKLSHLSIIWFPDKKSYYKTSRYHEKNTSFLERIIWIKSICTNSGEEFSRASKFYQYISRCRLRKIYYIIIWRMKPKYRLLSIPYQYSHQNEQINNSYQ